MDNHGTTPRESVLPDAFSVDSSLKSSQITLTPPSSHLKLHSSDIEHKIWKYSMIITCDMNYFCIDLNCW